MVRRRTAVLISGGGSNLQALIEAVRDPAYPAEIVQVVSNVARVHGLTRAAAAGIPAAVVEHGRYPDRASFEQAVEAILEAAEVELVCLAGFMRRLTAGFVDRWHDRLLNIHPSLLPAFPGLHTHERALEARVAVHGCTVHLVRAALDDGPILVQGVAPVLEGDSAASLAARVLELEHRCYPLALADVARGEVAAQSRLLVHPLLKEGPPCG